MSESRVSQARDAITELWMLAEMSDGAQYGTLSCETVRGYLLKISDSLGIRGVSPVDDQELFSPTDASQSVIAEARKAYVATKVQETVISGTLSQDADKATTERVIRASESEFDSAVLDVGRRAFVAHSPATQTTEEKNVDQEITV